MEWLKRRQQWRVGALQQIADWIQENNQGPLDRVVKNVVARRFDKLELFLRFYFPDAPPAPFTHEDAAALVILPRKKALKLARSLFGGGPGITRDLREEDLDYNMDWFTPEGWR
jgi:hypothetical protein